MKKIVILVLSLLLTVAMVAGCSNSSDNTSTDENTFGSSKSISVISREDGSGTRGAFIELFGVQQEDENGNKVDKTTPEADITNSTSVMMTTVAGNEYAIGYVSLGTLNDTVKAAKIDGAEASVANIENDSYKICRPFNIVTKSSLSATAQDFIDFILSADGQKVIEDNGYIAVAKNAAAYSGKNVTGKIVVAGSSSVTPVMEKIKEAYVAINPDVTVEVQQSDSSTGISSTIDGICDIGMASRDLRDSEKASGLTTTKIATDGIAVVVNNDNPVENLTTDQVCSIFTGEITTWSEVSK